MKKYFAELVQFTEDGVTLKTKKLRLHYAKNDLDGPCFCIQLKSEENGDKTNKEISIKESDILELLKRL